MAHMNRRNSGRTKRISKRGLKDVYERRRTAVEVDVGISKRGLKAT